MNKLLIDVINGYLVNGDESQKDMAQELLLLIEEHLNSYVRPQKYDPARPNPLIAADQMWRCPGGEVYCVIRLLWSQRPRRVMRDDTQMKNSFDHGPFKMLNWLSAYHVPCRPLKGLS